MKLLVVSFHGCACINYHNRIPFNLDFKTKPTFFAKNKLWKSACASAILFVPRLMGATYIANGLPNQSLTQMWIPKILGLPLDAPSKLILMKSRKGGCHLIIDPPLGWINFQFGADPTGRCMYFHTFKAIFSQWEK